jgi:hypothetical protein
VGGYKKEGFKSIEMEEQRAWLCWPQAAWCCGKLLVAAVVDDICTKTVF